MCTEPGGRSGQHSPWACRTDRTDTSDLDECRQYRCPMVSWPAADGTLRSVTPLGNLGETWLSRKGPKSSPAGSGRAMIDSMTVARHAAAAAVTLATSSSSISSGMQRQLVRHVARVAASAGGLVAAAAACRAARAPFLPRFFLSLGTALAGTGVAASGGVGLDACWYKKSCSAWYANCSCRFVCTMPGRCCRNCRIDETNFTWAAVGLRAALNDSRWACTAQKVPERPTPAEQWTTMGPRSAGTGVPGGTPPSTDSM
mmetsp:Transcript_11037/g.35031  ORF Transcript_11037/g.35031 Transcript_11037/m.35031 type:complete len:258 (+) Transcript_11037:415-1188(+)